jgi:hypothetical protein
VPNLDPWINQNEEHIDTKTITNKFENHLLSIKAKHQKMIHPNSHPTFNERKNNIASSIPFFVEFVSSNLKIFIPHFLSFV